MLFLKKCNIRNVRPEFYVPYGTMSIKIYFCCLVIYIVPNIMFEAKVRYSNCTFMHSGKASPSFITVGKINLELSEF
jgi:hypothetical protein